MGWLWSGSAASDPATVNSRSSPDETPSATARSWGLSDEQKQRIFGKSSILQDGNGARDTRAEKELEEAMNALAAPASTAAQIPTTKPEQPPQPSPHDRLLPDGTLNISPAALHPRTMSCRAAFDQAFYCQSLGGKFNDIYRYGSVQSCSEQWGAFWFCMRTKSLPKEEREGLIREHYAGREERKRREFGSSESVWQLRTRAVESAFGRDPDAVEGQV